MKILNHEKVVACFISYFLLLCSLGPTVQVENFSYEVLMDGQPIGLYMVTERRPMIC
jgi:hypothetical protein